MDEMTMEPNAAEELDFDAFLAADADDSGYQTEEDGSAEETEVQVEPAEGPESPAEEKNDSSDVDHQESENPAPSDGQEPADSNSEQLFTLKVNKEERQVSREEVISLAQKGSDYDRVKGQLEDARKTAADLQDKLTSQQDVMELITMMAEKSNRTPAEMVESLFISMQKAQGINEDAARETLRADKLQRQLAKVEAEKNQQKSAQENQAARAQKEVAEFRKEFPDVELTDELVNSIMADVQGGMSMVSAYRKAEAAKQTARIAELEAQLAAEKQNKANKKASPGSQRDSGGAKKRDAYDDFMEAFK